MELHSIHILNVWLLLHRYRYRPSLYLFLLLFTSYFSSSLCFSVSLSLCLSLTIALALYLCLFLSLCVILCFSLDFFLNTINVAFFLFVMPLYKWAAQIMLIVCSFSFQDPDTQVGDFQRKMELINSRMTNDRQYRHVQHLGNCKYSNKLTEKILIHCIVHFRIYKCALNDLANQQLVIQRIVIIRQTSTIQLHIMQIHQLVITGIYVLRNDH